jgi:3-oxoacyl-[acyl-carrier protein] reductase
MSAADRLAQVQGHLTNTFPSGLLANQTAIITGAGQGIGAEAAVLFAKEGARVVVADLDISKAEGVVKRISEAGGTAVAVGGDIMEQATIDRVINAAAKLGGGKIHHIVNNVSLFMGVGSGGNVADGGVYRPASRGTA